MASDFLVGKVTRERWEALPEDVRLDVRSTPLVSMASGWMPNPPIGELAFDVGHALADRDRELAGRFRQAWKDTDPSADLGGWDVTVWSR